MSPRAVEVVGEHHPGLRGIRRLQHEKDIERLEFLAEKGWTIVRVSATQLRWRREHVVQRVWTALKRAGYPD